MNDSDSGLEDLYQEYWIYHSQMIGKGHKPLEIAAILVAQSMSIYKTVLSPEEYDKMVDSIAEQRYKVKELNPEQGSYH